MGVAIPVGGISPTTPNTRHGVQPPRRVSGVRLPRLSLHYRTQHFPKGLALLPCRLEIPPDRCEALSPLGTPKRPGDVLAHLQHAQGAFRQIIGEGDAEIVEKSQRGVAITVQAFD